jgi:hypothetical protein
LGLTKKKNLYINIAIGLCFLTLFIPISSFNDENIVFFQNSGSQTKNIFLNEEDTQSSKMDLISMSEDTSALIDKLNPFQGFIPNEGQIKVDNNKIYYYFSTPKVTIWFGNSEIFYNLLNENNESITFKIIFENANNVFPIGILPKNITTNIYSGDMIFTNLNSFGELLYKDIYDGIDLKYYMSGKGLKYEFIVHPISKNNINLITMKLSDNVNIFIDNSNVLINNGDNLNLIPLDTDLFIYKELTGQILNSKFLKKGNSSYGFIIEENLDHVKENIIIDPLIFSTYLGGGNGETFEKVILFIYLLRYHQNYRSLL